MALERQDAKKIVDAVKVNECELNDQYRVTTKLTRPGYFLPADGKIVYMDVWIDKKHPIRAFNPKTFQDEVIYDNLIEGYLYLLNPTMPAIKNNGDGEKRIKILNASLTSELYTIPFYLKKAFRLNERYMLALDEMNQLVIYDLHLNGVRGYFPQSAFKAMHRRNTYTHLIELSPQHYIASTDLENSNIVSFDVINNTICHYQPYYPSQYSEHDFLFPATSSSRKTLDLIKIDENTFASLSIIDNRVPHTPRAQVAIWDNTTRTCIRTITVPEFIGHIEIMPDKKTLIGYGSSGYEWTFNIWFMDIQTGQLQSIPNPPDIISSVYSVFHPANGNVIFETYTKLVMMHITPTLTLAETVLNDNCAPKSTLTIAGLFAHADVAVEADKGIMTPSKTMS